MRASVLAVAVAVGSYGCARPPYEAARRPGPPPARCYALEYPDDPDHASVFPAAIGFVEPGRRVVGLPSRAGRRTWEMFRGGGRWAPGAADSVAVSFSNGFSALELRLLPAGDTVTGQAWFASDVIPDTPPPRARVLGHRTPCDPDEWG